MSLTPTGVKATWASIVGVYDQVLGEPEKKAFLTATPVDPLIYRQSIEALEARRRDAPEFFEGGAYDWAFDPEAYEFPMEAAFQVRCLDAAIGMWKADLRPRDEAKAMLSRIVARTTLLTNFHEGTPFVRHHAGIDFVVCPLAWPDVCFWYFAGFVRALADGRTQGFSPSATWPLVVDESALPDALLARPYWATILANVIASVGCSHDLLMPQAVARIAQEVPALSSAMVDNRNGLDAAMSNDLAYLAVEMALAHEVGHIFAGDHRDLMRNPNERMADFLAQGAFVNSSAWRDWCLQGSGLGYLGKIIVGMSAFGDVMRTLMAVRALVIGRIRTDARHRDALVANVEDLIARGERHAIQLDNYLAWAIRENHWPERTHDEAVVTGLQERLGLHARDFVLFVRSFPDEAIEAALKVAQDQRLE